MIVGLVLPNASSEVQTQDLWPGNQQPLSLILLATEKTCLVICALPTVDSIIIVSLLLLLLTEI
uniref:Uncharacterized protein n=1 Tax=Rhizophora mucronata TaxID=61149 RepID=A0A2P2P549_RHIMU